MHIAIQVSRSTATEYETISNHVISASSKQSHFMKKFGQLVGKHRTDIYNNHIYVNSLFLVSLDHFSTTKSLDATELFIYLHVMANTISHTHICSDVST